MNRVVVTGVGGVTPVGIGREEIWENIKNGVSGIVYKSLIIYGICAFIYVLYILKVYNCWIKKYIRVLYSFMCVFKGI